MIAWIVKHKKKLILLLDVLLIPAAILCERLSDLMLATEGECQWFRYGIRCLTCGGTHFVNYILNGRIIEAFQQNQLLFFVLVFLLLSLLFLNLFVLFDLRFAKKALRGLYSIPTAVIAIYAPVLFLIVRNIPFIHRLIRLVSYLVQTYLL